MIFDHIPKKASIVFLDVDGVLNSYQTMVLGQQYDAHSIMLLKKLCTECDAKIVITSAKRKAFPVKHFIDILEQHGFTEAPVIGMTDVNRCGTRGDEVNDWIGGNTEVRYVIIDDSRDFHQDQPLVLCNPVTGFGIREFIKAYSMLSDTDTYKDLDHAIAVTDRLHEGLVDEQN